MSERDHIGIIAGILDNNFTKRELEAGMKIYAQKFIAKHHTLYSKTKVKDIL